MTITFDDYALAKRLRLENIDARLAELKRAHEWWLAEYKNTGDFFAVDMASCMFELCSRYKNLRALIAQPGTVCYPKQIYKFPPVPES